MSSQVDPRAGQPRPPLDEQEQSPPGHETRMREKADHGEESYVGHGRLRGRVALVTGGDSGIGRAVCLAFAREGADVAVAYLEEHDDAAETRRLIEGEGRRALLFAGDVGDPAHCQRIVAETVSKLGRLDVVVNDAAFQGKSVDSIEELDPERIERTFRTNVEAMFFLVKAALPHLAPGSAIINVASIQAYQPSPGILDYASTKGAIVAFTKGLALELAKKGIRANAVAPGPVWTPLVASSFDEEHLRKFGEKNPLGRPAQPADVAPAFVFLACDESRFVNAEVLGVTGGGLLA
jgi:NAD(P)-dependent dehydrogenase (short-subunit alcohol dehydrogenase family)